MWCPIKKRALTLFYQIIYYTCLIYLYIRGIQHILLLLPNKTMIYVLFSAQNTGSYFLLSACHVFSQHYSIRWLPVLGPKVELSTSTKFPEKCKWRLPPQPLQFIFYFLSVRANSSLKSFQGCICLIQSHVSQQAYTVFHLL